MLDLLVEGPELKLSLNGMKDHLNKREIKKIITNPENIKLDLEAKKVFITIYNEGNVEYYPVRKSFVLKLFKWFHFPSSQFRYLNRETLVSVLNDYLINIKSVPVTIYLENLSAITITSKHYIEINDNNLIDMLKNYDVSSVIKNDYFTRIFLKTELTIMPFERDKFSCGINIINSETGFRAFSISTYLNRYICSNGSLIASKNFDSRFVHYGPNKESFYERFTNSIGNELANINSINDALKNLSRTKIENFKNERYKLSKVTGAKISNEIFRNLSKKSSLYDYFNEITSYAKGVGENRKLILEEFAGSLMN
jgi:hypothetical protein